MTSANSNTSRLAREIKSIFTREIKERNLRNLTESASKLLKIEESQVLDLIWNKEFNDPCHCANLVAAVGIAMTYLNAFYTSISYSEEYRVYRIESENGEFIEIPFALFQMQPHDNYQTENNIIIKGRINDNSETDEEWDFRRLTFKSVSYILKAFNLDLNKIQSEARLMIYTAMGLPVWRDASQTGRNIMAIRITDSSLWYNIIISRCDFLSAESFIPVISKFKEI